MFDLSFVQADSLLERMTNRERYAVSDWVKSRPLVAAVVISLNGSHRHITAVTVSTASEVPITSVTPGEPADVWTNISAGDTVIVVPVDWVGSDTQLCAGVGALKRGTLAIVDVAPTGGNCQMLVPIVISGSGVCPLGIPQESVAARIKRRIKTALSNLLDIFL